MIYMCGMCIHVICLIITKHSNKTYLGGGQFSVNSCSLSDTWQEALYAAGAEPRNSKMRTVIQDLGHSENIHNEQSFLG